MWIRNVDVPDRLLDAQRRGELVVFAGAGVSIPRPSAFPSFKKLTERLAAGSPEERQRGEPLDRYLGRLKAKGINVHERAREVFSSPGSRPNELHRSILRLFRGESSIRVVTTNFDRHFAETAEALSLDVEVHSAPALPIGSAFTGIVYLHGSVMKPAETLILTDDDFGRAYLTQGWARRFLQEVFGRFTTLFVGYSHDDPIMHYLARGLPASDRGSRFAIAPERSETKWRFLGVEPATYPRVKYRPHSEMANTLAGWANLTQVGSLGQEHRIRDLVDGSPVGVNREDEAYLLRALSEEETVRYFCRHAAGEEWLTWAESHGLLDPLLDPSATQSSISRDLASWFANKFAITGSEEALLLIERHGSRLSPLLWDAVAGRLFRDQEHEIPAAHLARWLLVLLGTIDPRSDRQLLDFLLRRCHDAGNEHLLIVLVDYLMTPVTRIRRSFRMSESDDEVVDTAALEVETAGDPYWLEDAWTRYLKPNVATHYARLVEMLAAHLRRATYFYRSAELASEDWDPVSLSRSAIEAHEQDPYKSGLHVVIDALRDCSEEMLRQNEVWAASCIDQWSNSDVQILKRLAAHVIAENERLAPHERVAWLLEKRWLYSYGLKHEVFRILHGNYTELSAEQRTLLLESIETGPAPEMREELDEGIIDYEIFNLLYWVTTADPDCSLAAERFQEFGNGHPEFETREYPDFDQWGGSIREVAETALTEETLLSRDPDSELNWFLDREHEILVRVPTAVGVDHDWSMRLAMKLASSQRWDSTLWEGLIQGWQATELTSEQRRHVLEFLLESPDLCRWDRSLSSFLFEIGSALEEHAEDLALAERLAAQLWDSIARPEERAGELEISDTAENDAPTAEQRQDWVQLAINHPAGKVAEFLLHAIASRARQLGDDESPIRGEARELADRILNTESDAAELGRVVLAGHLHVFYSVDRAWAQQELLRLFDWSASPRQAEQAWHGFLCWGRITEPVRLELMPFYEQTFSELSRLGRYRDRFFEHLSSIALFSSGNPLEDGWLYRFIAAVGVEDRVRWLNQVGMHLRGVSNPDEVIPAIWSGWLDEFWLRRSQGVPVALAPDELERMIHWSVRLTQVFPAVVAHILRVPAPPLLHTFLYHDLRTSELAGTYPEESALLLRHLLASAAADPFLHCDDLEEIVTILIQAGASRDALREVCDHLARLGCAGAARLAETLDGWACAGQLP